MQEHSAKYLQIIRSREFSDIRVAVEAKPHLAYRQTDAFTSLLTRHGLTDPHLQSVPGISELLGVDSRSIVRPSASEDGCSYLGGYPEEFAVYGGVRVIGEGPSAVLSREAGKHRRPEVKAFQFSGDGLHIGYYKNIPLLMRVGGGQLESIGSVVPKAHQFVNIMGGISPEVFCGGRRSVENAVFIGDSFSFMNYAHWVLDWFPRLHWLSEYVPPRDLSIVFNRIPPAYVWQMLEAVGFRRENVIHPGGHSSTFFVAANNVYGTNLGVEFRHACHNGALWAIEFLRNRLCNDDCSPFGDGLRIIVVRDNRGIALHPSSLEILRKLGFVFVKPDLLDHKMQVAIFSNAAAVIASHGAGLANLAFCKPGTKVLELFNGALATHAFYTVSNFGGLDYSCAVSPSAVAPKSGSPIDTECYLAPDILGEWISLLGH